METPQPTVPPVTPAHVAGPAEHAEHVIVSSAADIIKVLSHYVDESRALAEDLKNASGAWREKLEARQDVIAQEIADIKQLLTNAHATDQPGDPAPEGAAPAVGKPVSHARATFGALAF